MMNTYIIGIAYQQGHKGTNDGVHIMLVLLINKATMGTGDQCIQY